MDIKTAGALLSFIIIFLSYLVVITPAGYFRAWVAGKLGDDTAEELGFLTMNPLAHIDIIGVILLALFNSGWGKYIPINPFNIHGRHRTARLLGVYLSDSLIHFIGAFIALIALFILFGAGIVQVIKPMLIYNTLAPHDFVRQYPLVPSFMINLGLFLVGVLYLNAFLCALSVLINLFIFLGIVTFGHVLQQYKYSDLLMLVLPFIVLILLLDPLRMLVLFLIIKMSNLFALFLS